MALCNFCAGDEVALDRVKPGLLEGTRKYGKVMSSRADKRKAAWGRLEEIVEFFGNSENDLGLLVARRLLEISEGRSDLPLWLTKMLGGLGGTNGLFATVRGKEGTRVEENSSGLLRLYMEWGLYLDALKLVRDCLSCGGKMESRRARVLKEVPEKGGIEYVPYNTIDVLFELVEETLSGGLGGSNMQEKDRNELNKAKEDTAKVLREHFEVVKLGEEGLVSARALARD